MSIPRTSIYSWTVLIGFVGIRYFLEQNAALASGQIEGVHVNLTTLGVGNGMTVSRLYSANTRKRPTSLEFV